MNVLPIVLLFALVSLGGAVTTTGTIALCGGFDVAEGPSRGALECLGGLALFILAAAHLAQAVFA